MKKKVGESNWKQSQKRKGKLKRFVEPIGDNQRIIIKLDDKIVNERELRLTKDRKLRLRNDYSPNKMPNKNVAKRRRRIKRRTLNERKVGNVLKNVDNTKDDNKPPHEEVVMETTTEENHPPATAASPEEKSNLKMFKVTSICDKEYLT